MEKVPLGFPSICSLLASFLEYNAADIYIYLYRTWTVIYMGVNPTVFRTKLWNKTKNTDDLFTFQEMY